jgi:hypothetical protein
MDHRANRVDSRAALVGAVPLLALALLAGCGTGDTGPDGADIPFSTSGWSTDFAEHSVPLDEFRSGGPPKDGIPAIDHPRLVSTAEADEFLATREPVAVLELGGVARAYPLQILVWHEIVNDEIDGQPVAVTYCPLCNSTVAFSREVDGRTLDFGTTGKLRNSDLVMYDRRTESWWQQLTADAVVGELTGTKLQVLPSQILPWSEFLRLHPDGEVLSRQTGFARPYGHNPYVGYDQPDSPPYLFQGETDDALPPKERVAAVTTTDGGAVVYPFDRLASEAPVNDRIDGRPIVVMFDPDVASPLDASSISSGRDVGAAAVFDRIVRGRALSFGPGAVSGEVRDLETGSIWDLGGRATAGPLAGSELRQVPHDDQFWFALAAFYPGAEIRRWGCNADPRCHSRPRSCGSPSARRRRLRHVAGRCPTRSGRSRASAEIVWWPGSGHGGSAATRDRRLSRCAPLRRPKVARS